MSGGNFSTDPMAAIPNLWKIIKFIFKCVFLIFKYIFLGISWMVVTIFGLGKKQGGSANNRTSHGSGNHFGKDQDVVDGNDGDAEENDEPESDEPESGEPDSKDIYDSL